MYNKITYLWERDSKEKHCQTWTVEEGSDLDKWEACKQLEPRAF